jgi:hypothetical protein
VTKRKVIPKDSGYRFKYGNLYIRRFEKQRNPKPISCSPMKTLSQSRFQAHFQHQTRSVGLRDGAARLAGRLPTSTLCISTFTNELHLSLRPIQHAKARQAAAWQPPVCVNTMDQSGNGLRRRYALARSKRELERHH